jgi:WS/DGAT/MGAT family acyltransferase
MERLTPLSAAFLQAEDEDPTTTMAIASAAIFEGPAPAQDELVAHIAGRIPMVPQYRQRVRRVPLDLGPPVWEDDPSTDLTWHVRRTALPTPGGPAELHRLIARIMSARMDRTRPLWEYWVVEGLDEGRWALLQKVHHCVVDGVSGAALYEVLFDPSPEPRPPAEDTWVPRDPASTLGLTARAVRDLAWRPIRGVGVAASSLARSPLDMAERVADTVRGTASLVGSIAPVTSTSLTGQIGRQRRYTSSVVSLREVRAIRRAHGVTINDVALAAITGGFRALLLARGETPDPHAVRTLVPVSVRAPGEEGIPDNRVSLMLPFLPVDEPDPVARLHAVRERIAEASDAGEAAAGGTLTEVSVYEPYLPVALGVKLAFRLPQRQLVTVTTNVPGPRAPLYALGRRCVRILPYVPIADRLRIGIAIFSYCDELAFGITGDYDTMPDLTVFRQGILDAVDELRATVPGAAAS